MAENKNTMTVYEAIHRYERYNETMTQIVDVLHNNKIPSVEACTLLELVKLGLMVR